MFCFQCQETLKNTACLMQGVCGKSDPVANLQDLLIFTAKGISFYNLAFHEAAGSLDEQASLAVYESLFTTITNVNFDGESIRARIRQNLNQISRLKEKIVQSKGSAYLQEIEERAPDCAKFSLAEEQWPEAGHQLTADFQKQDEDLRSFKSLILFGLKGIAAYADHAWLLGFRDEKLDFFVQQTLVQLEKNLQIPELLELTMKTGENAVAVMKMLDRANQQNFGIPEVTEVQTGTRSGYCILVSGHDLLDLKWLLEQTAGSGVDVYTHSEMLPAHSYPGLKKFPHLAGNYGSSWHNQQKDFAQFKGAILMTTNWLQKPLPSYQEPIFTTGLVGWPGIRHIPANGGKVKDFSAVIATALKSGKLEDKPGKKLITGFARDSILARAEKIIEMIRRGKIRKFIVMAGCDGRFKEREYYTEFAAALPADTIILTAGCAKYRYNSLDLGSIDGIERILDAGQCNDSYSLAYVALKLQEAFGLESVADLPVEFNIAWYEQKAVAVFLALLYLGFKRINLGPTLPAFVSPRVAKLLTEKFQIGTISNVAGDLQKMNLI